MWTRRSDLEIQELLTEKERRNRSLIRPLIYGVVIGLLSMALLYLGFRGGSLRFGFFYTSAGGFSWQTVGTGVLMGVIVFASNVYYQKKGLSFFSDGNRFRRCDGCKELSHINGEMRCACGGKLEPSEFYTWEED